MSVRFLPVIGSGVGRGGGKRDVCVIFNGVEVRLRKVRFAMVNYGRTVGGAIDFDDV
jgi:hypothetical protein